MFVFASIFDWFADVARSQWAYLVAPAVILVDTFVGVLPAETVLHATGVGAAHGDVVLYVAIPIAAAAAVLADFTLYVIGTKGSDRIRGWLIRGERSRRRFEGACNQLRERTWLLTIARFIPGLRTVTMVAAGATGLDRGRFFAYEVPGALLWSTYNVLIGYFLGLVFKNSGFWVPLLVSAAVAAALTVVFEVVRRSKLKLGQA